MLRAVATIALLSAIPAIAAETAITFDGGWREQRFSPFWSNDFEQAGDALRVRSDGTVSLLWRPVPESASGARAASWRWEVSESPPPTDLTVKGGDDRALALYFLFLPESAAEAYRGEGIRALLEAEEARVLVYTVGGRSERGSILPSPYLGARGRTVTLRGAGTGAWSESVDLAADFRRAFGEEPTALTGLAVSADSDDTDSSVRAELADLALR